MISQKLNLSIDYSTNLDLSFSSFACQKFNLVLLFSQKKRFNLVSYNIFFPMDDVDALLYLKNKVNNNSKRRLKGK